MPLWMDFRLFCSEQNPTGSILLHILGAFDLLRGPDLLITQIIRTVTGCVPPSSTTVRAGRRPEARREPIQDAGGLRREDRKKAGSTSDSRKIQYLSQTGEQGQESTQGCRSCTTVRGISEARREPSAGCSRAEEQGQEEGRVNPEGPHRQFLYTRSAMTDCLGYANVARIQLQFSMVCTSTLQLDNKARTMPKSSVSSVSVSDSASEACPASFYMMDGVSTVGLCV